MKKIIIFILTLTILFTLPINVCAAVTGKVLSTDIGAMIDCQPIQSYNINGCTYVIAEDLAGYGFDVTWDAAKRILSIVRNPDAKKTFISKDKINQKKSKIVPGQPVYNVYDTDIRTYLGEKEIDAYNVDGKTLIMIDELSRYGYCRYDDESRIIRVDMFKFDADTAYENSSKQTLPLPCDKTEGTITYCGDVSDAQPNGLGKITKHYEYTNGLQSIEDYTYTGGFSNGIFNGRVYYEGYKHPLNGSDTRDSQYLSYYTYDNGILNGYTMECELIRDRTRTEYIYENGKAVWKRCCKIDPDYVYGYFVTEEGNLDTFDAFIDYTKMEEPPKIISVEAGEETSYAIDEDHNLYYFGQPYIGTLERKAVPVKIDENIGNISADGVTAVTDTSGNLYYLADKLFTYHNANAPTAAANVKSISSTAHLCNDATLWLRPVDLDSTRYEAPTKLDTDVAMFSGDSYLLYLKNDGSVWTVRKNSQSDSGSSWIDGLDLSAPQKVMEDGKYVNADTWYFVIKNDNTLWTWTSCYYGTAYDGTADDGVLSPTKITDDVAQVGAGNGSFIAYLKTDGSLWVMPDTRFDTFSPLFESLTEPVCLLDDVQTFSCGFNHMLILKCDGTLWTWGQNANGQLGDGTNTSHETPVQITNFCETVK